ncbi:MAG: YcgL domain-containing protein [Chromatiaceae bacterium]|nr:YcgL domain-containing protein [Chromatiaceae bacterium]
MSQEPRPCWIYKSPRKEEMYLYLATQEGFAALPPALLEHFGPPVFVMELALHPERRLAREDVVKVMANLDTQGFHLQMPPEIRPDFLPAFHQSTLH